MISTSDPTTRFVPEGTEPKVYSVICENESDWKEIDSYIINENKLDGIPNRAIGCVNPYKTCNRMASYEMSDAEAEQLRNHPKVIGVDYCQEYYQGTYDDSIYKLCSKTNRYDSNIKVSRVVYSNSTEEWLSKAAGNIGRHQDHLDPWYDISNGYMFNKNPQYYGDGTGVDVIVNDTAAWFGHIEFVKTGVGEPTHYNGTNILKNGFATSATTGVCDVLDVILHSPYYIDPDWFEEDPTNRLEKRWDGTTIPKKSAADSWWGTERCLTNITIKLTDSSNAANFKLYTLSDGSLNYPNHVQLNLSLTSSGGTLSNGEVTVEVTETINGTLELQQSDSSWVQGPWSFTYDLVSSTNTPSSGEISIYSNDIYISIYDKSGSQSWPIFFAASQAYGTANRVSTRSPKYVGVRQGGTATTGSPEDFGTITISSNYTEAIQNGNNTTVNTGLYNGSVNSHGTACMSQAYGKTQGWAFNSNKWFIAKWSLGSPNAVKYFMILKVFHQLKPKNQTHLTKDPTLASHSWVQSIAISDGNYAYFRTNGDGTGEETISVSSGNVTSPAWVSYFYKNDELDIPKSVNSQEHINCAELIDAGVVFFAAAGNNNQKMVLDGHPDYNNYVSTSASRTLAQAKSNGYEMANRPGFPASGGLVENYNGSGIDKYRSFNVGALDAYKGTNTQEQKATYSNMGEAIDFYAIGGGSLSATNLSSGSSRYDSYYRIDNYQIVTTGGTLSYQSKNRTFSGTSSACPVGAGLVATKLGLNRTWTWDDIKNWFKDNVTDQTESAFYTGTEATTASDSNWNSQRNLQGGSRKILWDTDGTPMPSDALLYIGECDGLTLSGDGLTILNI